MYGPMIGSREKILGSGGTSHPTYLDPLVPIFLAFSHFEGQLRPLKMNGYLGKLDQLLRLDIIY
jgi:hypothetical protein